MANTKKNIHICSNCFGEFSPKEIFISVCVHNNTYSTIYCSDCITELKIENMIPYIKPRKKKDIEIKEPKISKNNRKIKSQK